MEKKQLKKLSLSKETLRSLDDLQLQVAMGASGPTVRTYCKSCLNTTCCSG
ncbi:MAG TPA: class I lanthipeptide [Thermoanaerobaculia bacterium]|nr:class I lanthipeptide [Thermoanaerobaculia bacterium]